MELTDAQFENLKAGIRHDGHIIVDLRAKLELAERWEARLRWLHAGAGRDPEGYEWGVFRVKWNAHGQPASVLHTSSDLSDLDAEMRREAAAAANILPAKEGDGTAKTKTEAHTSINAGA